MPNVATRIRHWLGAKEGDAHASQEAARSQLQHHMDAELLNAFLQRAVDEEQHRTVIDHLNQCDPCREAVAIVLLAVDDPKAAVELELERKRRHEEEPEAWWKQALRWSALVIFALAIVIIALLIPKSKDPDSAVGRWFEQADNSVAHVFTNDSPDTSSSSSSTSFGQVFSSTHESVRHDQPRGTSRGVLHQFGWDSGPAPYVGKVEPSQPFREVEVFADRPQPERRAEATAASGSGEASVPARLESASKSGFPSSAQQHARRRLVVSPEGDLNRTLDGGVTWEHVIVSPGLVFRSLALSGHTVWASGDAGALYRSADAAEHWQQVQIHYRGEPIKDDLVAVQFFDPQHGVIRGATGREWITVDGGNKWVLNPTTAQK